MVARHIGGRPYSHSFLDLMESDLRELAADFEKSGGATVGAEKLRRAADVVKHIRIENDAEE